jgi:hypothetical protein
MPKANHIMADLSTPHEEMIISGGGSDEDDDGDDDDGTLMVDVPIHCWSYVESSFTDILLYY